MSLIDILNDRADEIEGFRDDVDALAPSGCDHYTAELLRAAAKELRRLHGERMVKMVHGVPMTWQVQQGD